MIVTRKRRRRFPWKRLLFPLIVLGLVYAAFSWPPARKVLASGPTAPALRWVDDTFAVVAAPFHFAAQNELLTERNQQIVALQGQLASAKKDAQGKDATIADLKMQVDQAQAQAASSRSADPARTVQAASVSPAPFAPVAGGTLAAANAAHGDLSTDATPDMRRTAQYWASMEPENAAKVVQRLPIAYVARIFALMSSDTAGAVLDALPPAYAAQLTQEHPELRR